MELSLIPLLASEAFLRTFACLWSFSWYLFLLLELSLLLFLASSAFLGTFACFWSFLWYFCLFLKLSLVPLLASGTFLGTFACFGVFSVTFGYFWSFLLDLCLFLELFWYLCLLWLGIMETCGQNIKRRIKASLPFWIREMATFLIFV